MKIIKHGTPLPTLTGSCEICKCEVEATKSETQLKFDRDSPEGLRYVRCPECGHDYLWVK